MKVWLLTGIIALIVVVAVGGIFMSKSFAKAETSTGNVVSTTGTTGCGCGENCACGCQGKCTEKSNCGCLSEQGCSAAKGTGSCSCGK